jgi:hypothetical protein
MHGALQASLLGQSVKLSEPGCPIMIVIDRPDFANLPDDYRNVLETGAEQSFFSLPAWYDIVARHGLEPQWKPLIYAEGGAALVVYAAAEDTGRELRSCCNMYTVEHSIPASRDCGDGDIRDLIAEAARHNRNADAILLTGLDPGHSSFSAALAGLKKAGFIAKPFFSWGTWFEPTRGRDFESYFASRPSVLKNTFRRKYAALQKIARVDFRAYGPIEEFIADYDDVYRRSWKVPEPFPDFIPALMRMAAAKGALRYGVLEIDQRPVAAQFWIVWKGRAVIYKLAYDEKWSAFSPGTLLTMGMIRHVLTEDRPDEINFGRGDDDYKKLWMSRRRELWGIEAANPRTARGFSRAVGVAGANLRDRLLGRVPPVSGAAEFPEKAAAGRR